MDIGKIVVIVIVFFALGMFVLPSTLSLFSGQHFWYNTKQNGSNVPCEKCHADVMDEMEAIVAPHTGETGYGKMRCEFCHRTENFTGVSYVGEEGAKAHAASTVKCIACHGFGRSGIHPITWNSPTPVNCTSCHPYADDWDHVRQYSYDYHECLRCHGWGEKDGVWGPFNVPPAGGFGLTEYNNDTGIKEVHKSFVLGSNNSKLLPSESEACISCHTRIRLEINFNVTSEAKIDVNDSYTLTTSYWDVVDFDVGNYTSYRVVRE